MALSNDYVVNRKNYRDSDVTFLCIYNVSSEYVLLYLLYLKYVYHIYFNIGTSKLIVCRKQLMRLNTDKA